MVIERRCDSSILLVLQLHLIRIVGLIGGEHGLGRWLEKMNYYTLPEFHALPAALILFFCLIATTNISWTHKFSTFLPLSLFQYRGHSRQLQLHLLSYCGKKRASEGCNSLWSLIFNHWSLILSASHPQHCPTSCWRRFPVCASQECPLQFGHFGILDHRMIDNCCQEEESNFLSVEAIQKEFNWDQPLASVSRTCRAWPMAECGKRSDACFQSRWSVNYSSINFPLQSVECNGMNDRQKIR